jgi:hypothetical protein
MKPTNHVETPLETGGGPQRFSKWSTMAINWMKNLSNDQTIACGM